MERAIIGRIEQFLRAMGGVFAFIGSQFRLEVDGDEFFVDLLPVPSRPSYACCNRVKDR